MEKKKQELIFKEEVYQIVGAAMNVLNTLGHGLLEKPYENAMVVELEEQGIPYSQQQKFEVIYKGVNVGNYIPDLIVFDKIIVELKTVEFLANVHRAQLINYLKIANHKVGVLLNFSKPKLQWERLVV